VAEIADRRQIGDGLANARISVGIASADPGPTRALLEGFCAALSAASKLRVTGVGVGHYRTLLDAIEKGEVDVGWLPPILAVQATTRGLVAPIALPVRSGFSCYSTALFVREDSSLHTVRDLVGMRAAWVDRQSAAGFLIIRAHLRSVGVDLGRAFASDQFLGSHSAVTRAVLEGDADVGATFAYIDPKSMSHPGHISPVNAGWGDAKVRILAHAGPIPSDVIAVSTRVPFPLRTQLQRMLVYGQHAGVRQAASALFGAEGFVAPLSEHLRPLTTLLTGLESTSEGPMSTSPRTRR
jgi:phosphonate transport system substrate-binding protein